jgi:putative endonuclease
MSNVSWQPFYTGVTSNLFRRAFQHKQHRPGSYTAQYNIDRLLWYRQFHEVRHAIAYEKVVKKYSRAKKLTLIRKLNPNGDDLSRDWFKPEWFRGEIAVSRKP